MRNRNSTAALFTNRENGIFTFDPLSKGKMTDEEYTLILKAILRIPKGKKGLIECAKKHSKEFPPFVALSEKKNVDEERIIKIYRNVLCGKNKNSLVMLFSNMVRLYIDVINRSQNIISNSDKFSTDILASDKEEYGSAIKLLSNDIDITDVIWFLKITGNEPNDKQMEIINEIKKQYQEEEKSKDIIREIANEAVAPISKKALEIQDKVNTVSSELEQLKEVNSTSESEIGKINAQIDDISSQISERAAISSINKHNIEKIEESIAQLDKAVKNINGKLSENKNDKLLSDIKIQSQDNSASIKNITQSIDICNSDLIQLSKFYRRISDEIAELQAKIAEESEKKISVNHMTGNVMSAQAIIEPAVIIDENPEQCNLGEFADNLSDIFRQCRISCDPHYLTSIISSGFHPMFVGYSARETALAVSIALTGQTPTIVSLPTDFNNIAELGNICCNADSKVVLIEDGVGAMRDKMFYPIFRKIKSMDKKPYLFLLSESNEELELIPQSFYLHTTLIQCNDIDVYVNPEGIEACSISDVMCNLKELSEFKDNKRKLKRIFADTDLSDMYCMRKETLFRYYCQGTVEYAVTQLISNEIKYIFEDADTILHKTGVRV